jgi:thiamine biosynthesis protein ThiS
MPNAAIEIAVAINGKTQMVPEGESIGKLLDRLALGRTGIAVEVNRTLVARDQYDVRRLRQGDIVEIVTFVGGG